MKTISILSKVCINLSLALGLQQLFYGAHHNELIDFSTWTATALGFETLFILSIVFSSIVRANRLAVRPMKSNKPTESSKPKVFEHHSQNSYTPKED